MSPDGRFVAYATEPREGSTDHYVYVFDTVSLRETAIVTAAGSREAPVWTADGGHLLYEEGAALKSVAVHDGQPAGEPRILHNGFNGMAIGVTATGTFHYSNNTGGGNYHFILPRTPSVAERPLTFAGLGSSWSPDGRQVAFVRGNAMASAQLVIRDVESGEERSYPRQGLSESPRWLPDGKSVIVVATDRVGGSQRAGFYKVDLSTGQEVRLFDRDANGRSRTGVASLSPDGKTLYLGVHANQDAPVTGIVAVDLATGEERQVVTFTSADRSNDLGIAVSPDGNTLAVTAWTKAYATARLFTVATNGSGFSRGGGLVRDRLARRQAALDPGRAFTGLHRVRYAEELADHARCRGRGYTGVRRRQLRRDFVAAPVVQALVGQFQQHGPEPGRLAHHHQRFSRRRSSRSGRSTD